MATIEWSRERASFALAASRLGRRVATLAHASTDADRPPMAVVITKAEEDVIGLRLHPPYRVITEHGFVEPGPRAELVAQPWTFDLIDGPGIDQSRFTLELPPDAGPGRIGKPDPWYELAGATFVSGGSARGAVRRGPGITLGQLESYEPYYLERFDGTLDAAKAIAGDVRHTFLVR
jgi:hypothetical protein